MPLEKVALHLGVAALAVLSACAPPAAAAPDGALDRALDRIAAAPGGPPGMVLVIQRGERRDVRVRGLARVSPRRRATARDHMRIASVAKTFNGAIALRLVEEGRLALDETIGERLPGLLPRADDVTLAQALHHTSGLPDYIRDAAFIRRLQRDPGRGMPPRRLVRYVAEEPLHFKPGSRYAYSDTDNIVVGLMAEAATGVPYDELLRRHVLQPLSLHGTSLPDTLRIPRPTLHGYEVVAGSAPDDVTRLINPALAWASGGMLSTPIELGRFMRAYVGGRLFDARLQRAQRRFVPGSSSPPGPGRNAAGLGLFRYRTGCGTVYGHTGSYPGYRLFAASSSDGRRSVTFVANAQIVPGQGSQAVSRQIRRMQRLAVCRALR